MTKLNNGRFVKGNKGIWLGKKRSEETKSKISRTLKEKKLLGDLHPNWKGGRSTTSDGYVLVYAPNHPRVKNHKKKYLFEHIIVLEKKIGRMLLPHEQCHHINEIRNDNRPENLQLVTQSEHGQIHGQIGDKEKYNIPIEYIEENYIKQKNSINAIAKKLGVSQSTITHRIKKYGYKIRTRR